jgi:hypothetical protein
MRKHSILAVLKEFVLLRRGDAVCGGGIYHKETTTRQLNSSTTSYRIKVQVSNLLSNKKDINNVFLAGILYSKTI